VVSGWARCPSRHVPVHVADQTRIDHVLVVREGGSYCPTDNGSVYYGDFPYNQYMIDPGLISNMHWHVP
ncbi:MAG: hypothetical protein QNJ12_11965, partial [Ilumatobacter sp.]|uniref:hypothetical protein n=1 Tax=Ilumatobacter sp. TaxID=1967498 RepID=UPI00262A3FAD